MLLLAEGGAQNLAAALLRADKIVETLRAGLRAVVEDAVAVDTPAESIVSLQLYLV